MKVNRRALALLSVGALPAVEPVLCQLPQAHPELCGTPGAAIAPLGMTAAGNGGEIRLFFATGPLPIEVLGPGEVYSVRPLQDGRSVGFVSVNSIPQHSDNPPSGEYLLYDLSRSPADNRVPGDAPIDTFNVGNAIFPVGRRTSQPTIWARRRHSGVSPVDIQRA